MRIQIDEIFGFLESLLLKLAIERIGIWYGCDRTYRLTPYHRFGSAFGGRVLSI